MTKISEHIMFEARNGVENAVRSSTYSTALYSTQVPLYNRISRSLFNPVDDLTYVMLLAPVDRVLENHEYF